MHKGKGVLGLSLFLEVDKFSWCEMTYLLLDLSRLKLIGVSNGCEKPTKLKVRSWSWSSDKSAFGGSILPNQYSGSISALCGYQL